MFCTNFCVSLYYRTVRFKLDIARYTSRNPKLFCKNL